MMIGKHLLGESTVQTEEPSIISPLCSMMNNYRPLDSNSSVYQKQFVLDLKNYLVPWTIPCHYTGRILQECIQMPRWGCIKCRLQDL